MTQENEYQVIIIGGGPAGLAAGLYASRAGLTSLLLEKGLVGGQIANAELVDNYPGFTEGIGGLELGELMYRQAMKYGVKTVPAEVTGLVLVGEHKMVETTGESYIADTVIIASGSERNKLVIPGEDRLIGKGVSYCATCDAPFFRQRPVAVVGGGDAAITEALHLAKFANRVIVIHRRDRLRAAHVLGEKAVAEPGIEFLWSTVVEEIEGQDKVERLRLRQVITGEKSGLNVAGIFISVGITPSTGFLRGIVSLDAQGHVITNSRMETAVPGVFAAGDVRQDSARQAITAAGDGATAAIYAQKYLTE